MHTERLVAARELTPEIYSNKVGKVDLGFAFHYSLNEKFQEWVKKTFQEWDDILIYKFFVKWRTLSIVFVWHMSHK